MKLILVDTDRTYIAQSYFYMAVSDNQEPEMRNIENLSMWKVKGNKNTIMICYKSSRITDLLRYERLFKGELTTQNIENSIIPKVKEILGKYGQLNSDGHMHDDIYIAKNNDLLYIGPDFKYIWVYNYFCLNMDDIVKPILHYNNDLSPLKKIELAFNELAKSYNHRSMLYAVLDTKTEKIKYFEKEVDYGYKLRNKTK